MQGGEGCVRQVLDLLVLLVRTPLQRPKINLPPAGGKDFLVLELLYTGGCSDRHWDDNVVNIEGALSPSPPYWLSRAGCDLWARAGGCRGV